LAKGTRKAAMFSSPLPILALRWDSESVPSRKSPVSSPRILSEQRASREWRVLMILENPARTDFNSPALMMIILVIGLFFLNAPKAVRMAPHGLSAGLL